MKKRLAVSMLVLTLLVSLIPIGINATDNYEPNDSCGTATDITPYNSLTASRTSYISTSTDVDYYKFTASTLAYLTLSSPNGKDYDLYLYDKDNNLVISATGTARSESTLHVTNPGETYYIKVVGKDGAYDVNNPYTLILSYKFLIYM